MMKSNIVIVIGGDHHNTLGVIRSLGYRGIKSILILVSQTNKTYVNSSKFLNAVYRVNNDEDAIDLLIEKKEEFSNGIIIACSDGISSMIDCNKDKLSDFAIPGSNIQGRVTELMNKETMSNLAMEVGLNVPKSWIVATKNDLKEVQYPCITKPILSKDGHKSDIKICESSNDIEKVLDNGSCYRYQVQEFITKDFEYQLIGLSLHNGEEVIIPGFSKCIRPCPGTNTGFLHYESLDTINAPIQKCEQFIKEVGYSGLFSIEFLRDKNGVDYFMEMNFRNDGNAICVTAAGINLPYIWYLANTKGDYESELKKSLFKAVYVMPEFADFKYFVLTRKISFFNWIKDLRKTDKFMEYDRLDPKPFWTFLFNKFR